MKRTTRNQTKKSENLQEEIENLYKSALNFKPTHSPSKENPLLESGSDNEELDSTIVDKTNYSVIETQSGPSQPTNFDSTPILS